MTSSHLKHLNVRHLTNNQPFCAGIILVQDGCLVATLNTDGLPTTSAKNQAWRLSGIGGGQEPGETIWECALREASEELCVDVEFMPSPITYFYDVDTGETYSVECTDSIAPFLLERQSNLFPYTPYRPGLPSGPYTYFGNFLVQTQQTQLQPGDDVEGLLLIPPDQWTYLQQQQPTLGEALQHGCRIIEHTALPRTRQLWVHPHESLGIVISLLQQHPELQFIR